MAASVFTSFDRQAQALWGNAPLRLNHTIHERPMFTDEGLADIVDRLPDDLISIVTMGDDQRGRRDWSYWPTQRPVRRGVDRVVKQGRIWINIIRIEKALPEFRDLLEEIYDAIEEKAPGLGVYSKSVGPADLLAQGARLLSRGRSANRCGNCAARSASFIYILTARPSCATATSRMSFAA